ncbi:putative MFS-type transporter EfpA [Micromonospora sp. MH33]|uniref:MFS transporter n=1 Tax=Micromonospora sp. MH33 TaxID=1945509 RepID=UPI000D14B225|nr:MFS transporter [Micromonospora sp. MH33]PSK66853.1 putative MFS-type transporter EfpA [Micromonospora sp. MH33]
MTDPNGSSPAAGAPHRWRALAVLAFTQFLLILDTAIINVAVPSIGADLHISPTGLSWVANAYLITFGGLLLLGGRSADHVGRRRIFVIGLVVLVVGSAVGAVANSAGLLIAGRAIQGLAAALAAAAALALVLGIFPEGPERHRALGIFAAMAGAGGAVGTVLGGVLTDSFGWRSTFLLNVVAGAVLVVFALRLVPDVRAPRDRRAFDALGAVTVTAGLGLLAYALVSTGDIGWLAGRTVGAAALAVLCLVAFVFVERGSSHPLVPLGIFRRRRLRTANILGGLAQLVLFPTFFFVSIYLQDVLGYSPLGGGLGLLPMSLMVIAVAPTCERLIARFGLEVVMTTGFVLVGVGMLWLSRLSADGDFVSEVLGPTVILGVGLPLATVTTNVAATAEAADNEVGLASGLINTSQQIGAVVGLAVMAGVAAARTSQVTGDDPVRLETATTAGFQTAFLVGAVVSLVAAVAAVRLRQGRPAPVDQATVSGR